MMHSPIYIRSKIQVFGLGLFGPGCGHISDTCEHKNEPRFSLKGREIFDWQRHIFVELVHCFCSDTPY